MLIALPQIPAKFLDSDRHAAYNGTISHYSLIEYSFAEQDAIKVVP
jgi:hypothetical protein